MILSHLNLLNLPAQKNQFHNFFNNSGFSRSPSSKKFFRAKFYTQKNIQILFIHEINLGCYWAVGMGAMHKMAIFERCVDEILKKLIIFFHKDRVSMWVWESRKTERKSWIREKSFFSLLFTTRRHPVKHQCCYAVTHAR